MKYIYLLLFIGITSHCYAWSPAYKTNDRITNYNFEDLSTVVVDNYSDQNVGGNKTFTGVVKGSSVGVTELFDIATTTPSFVGQFVMGTDLKVYAGTQTVTCSWSKIGAQ